MAGTTPDGSPRRDWIFLPPAARPFVLALSCGVAALILWDRAVREPEPAPIHPAGAAKVVSAADAPISRDFSRQVSGAEMPADRATTRGSAASARRQDAADRAPDAAAPARPAPKARAPGGPLGIDEPPAPPAAMTEEDRSARNEKLIERLEKEKARMGIVSVLPRSEPPSRRSAISSLFGSAGPAPAAVPVLNGGFPALIGRSSGGPFAENPTPPGPGRSAPEAADRATTRGSAASERRQDAALVFTEARGLASSWVLLGLPAAPPAIDFSTRRAVLLKPSATKIASMATGPDAVTIVFRSLRAGEDADPARDRLAIIPLEPRTVLVFGSD